MPAILYCFVLVPSGWSEAPSLTIAGAYFPAWLLCAILGLIVAMTARGLMVITRLAEIVPYQLAVCSAVGVIAALLVWRKWVVS